MTYIPDLKSPITLALSLLPHQTKMQPIQDPDKQHVNGQPAKRWLIIVARNQADLFTHLTQAFSHDTKVRVILDRRKDDSRNSPQLTQRLRTHGAAIIRQTQ